MRLVTFEIDGQDRLGALSADHVIDLSGVANTMMELINAGKTGLAKAKQAVKQSGPANGFPLSRARLLAPIPRPGKVLCSGINYKGHADENPNAKMPTYPHFFAKVSTAIANPEDEIKAPVATRQMDYEVEFAAVIGKRLTNPREQDVMSAIFGYTLLNDVSARDVQFADNQITTGKNFDRFAPIGPCIVTSDELTDPNDVRLKTRLNGRLMQDGTTADWLFKLPRLIGYLANVMTLEPGDIVSTGTPAGIGYFQKPQVFMKPGDTIEIEASGIGVLRNRIV
jgi:2-keto-4-pentenoate hydratase/2-oxohepta-3-ene-1,7-dioic acid hydratase in catechol pathway